MEWYVKVIKNYVGFEGRARRKEYWMFFLINVIISIALGVLDAVLGTAILGTVYSLAVILPSLAVGARRLHDTGRSGWWLLIGLIPLIGLIVLIIFFVQEGKEEANQFGANPKLAV